MKKFLQEYGYAMYLGGAVTAFVGSTLDSWQWWAIVIPTVFLVTLRGKNG